MLRLVVALVVVSLTTGLAGFGFIYWRAQDPSIINGANLPASPDPQILALLQADAASAAVGWWGLVILAIAIAALIFLILALRRRPETMSQARSGSFAWWLLLGVALLAAGAASYGVYTNVAVAAGWRFALLISGLLVVPVCYWMITAFGVQNEMAPSVPFATVVRS